MLVRPARLAIALAALLAGPALADEHEASYAKPGVYIGGSMNHVFSFFPKADAGVPGAAPPRRFGDVGNTFAGSIRAGYRAHPRFSIETELELPEGFDLPRKENLDAVFWTGNLKAYLLTGRWQPFVVAGAGILSLKADVERQNATDEVAAAARFGGGLDYYATDNLALTFTGAYWVPFGKLQRFDALSIGIGFHYILRAR